MTKTEETGPEILVEAIEKKGNVGLRILLTTSAIGTLVAGVFSPYYVIYVQKLGGSLELAGSSLAAFSIASGVLTLCFTTWESKVEDQRLLYAGGLFLRAFVFFLYFYISSYFELILAQVLLGVSVALINPSFDALFTKHLSKGKSVSDWGGWEGITAIAVGVAALVGGYIIEMSGFGLVFTMMAIISAATGMYLMLLPKNKL